jgi:hypothetical protein
MTTPYQTCFREVWQPSYKTSSYSNQYCHVHCRPLILLLQLKTQQTLSNQMHVPVENMHHILTVLGSGSKHPMLWAFWMWGEVTWTGRPGKWKNRSNLMFSEPTIHFKLSNSYTLPVFNSLVSRMTRCLHSVKYYYPSWNSPQSPIFRSHCAFNSSTKELHTSKFK